MCIICKFHVYESDAQSVHTSTANWSYMEVYMKHWIGIHLIDYFIKDKSQFACQLHTRCNIFHYEKLNLIWIFNIEIYRTFSGFRVWNFQVWNPSCQYSPNTVSYTFKTKKSTEICLRMF